MTTKTLHPITHIRSVAIGVPNLAKSYAFYRDLWQLPLVASDDDRLYFGAGCPENYILRLRESAESRVDLITFGVIDRAGVDALASRVGADAQSHLVKEPAPRQDAGAGYSCMFFDCDGRLVELAAEVEHRAFVPVEERESRPKHISHVVFNTPDLQRTRTWYEQVLGFKVSDWLQDYFCFMRTGATHHLVAFARSKNTSLNHLSFELRGLDEFMRGTGRLIRNGYTPVWGPGRHGAGDNTFSYFREPSTNFIMEYTTALQIIDEEHGWTPKVYGNSPEETDQWGTSNAFDDLVLAAMHPSTDPGLWVPPPA